MKNSPCVSCTRVADPEKCENKYCNVWRQWFISSWDRMRGYPRQIRQDSKPEPAGVSLGGRHYAAPHETVKYLDTDPCQRCPCPRDLCTTPCRVRRRWEEARDEVFV